MANRWYLKTELISHTRRVCSLYKRLIRDCEFQSEDFFEVRYKKLLIRAEFDKYKKIKDLREAKALLEKGEQYLFRTIDPFHGNSPPKHPFSKEGISYQRQLESPDYVMDWYHPLEKAQYPYYFAKREQMKDEYLELWKKKMMTPSEIEEVENKPDRS